MNFVGGDERHAPHGGFLLVSLFTSVAELLLCAEKVKIRTLQLLLHYLLGSPGRWPMCSNVFCYGELAGDEQIDCTAE